MTTYEDILNYKYSLQEQASIVNDTRSCIAADTLNSSEGSGLPWFEIFFGLRLFVMIVELVRDGHQICNLNK